MLEFMLIPALKVRIIVSLLHLARSILIGDFFSIRLLSFGIVACLVLCHFLRQKDVDIILERLKRGGELFEVCNAVGGRRRGRYSGESGGKEL